MNRSAEIDKLFKAFSNTKVLVIGDVMLDTYIWGDVKRVSPEAPVPIVEVNHRESRLGGAANVALNLQSLGATPILCSVVGNDEKATELNKLLKEERLTNTGILKSTERKTTTKFRIIGNKVQLLRVDDEMADPLNKDEERSFIKMIEQILAEEKIDAILFQDYDKGAITEKIIREVVANARQKKIPVAVDPKKRNFFHYQEVTLFKPNLKELQEGLNQTIDATDLSSVEKAVTQLQDHLKADIIMNTLSEGGVFTRWREGQNYFSVHHQAHLRNIADVSGAGDTVISVATLCLAQGLKPDLTTALANLAGGLVCEEVGVKPVNKERLIEEITNSNIL
jgi:rfaE bifunctional protein kinase chain/domain